MSDALRNRIWEEWLSAEIRANYFAELAGIYRWRQGMSTWLTLFASSGAAGTLLGRLPEWLPALLAIGTAGISFYSIVAQNTQRSVDCADLHFRWNRLTSSFRALWDTDVDSSEAAAEFARLNDEAAAISKAGANALPNNKKRLRYWEDHVIRHRAPHSQAG